MDVKDKLPKLRVFGSMVVNSRGQVVIPSNARRELGIDSGDTLLVCGTPHEQGLLLLKVDALEQMLSTMSERLTSFSKLVKDYKQPQVASKKEGETK